MRVTNDLNRLVAGAEDKLPRIGRPVSVTTTSIDNGGAMMVLRVNGVPFESVSRGEIEARYDSWNRQLAAMTLEKGNRLSLWSTFRRRRVSFGDEYRFYNPFIQQAVDKYLQRFRKHHHYENSFYISAILQGDDLDESVRELEELGESLTKSLIAYDPQPLETYEHNGILFSEPYQFIGELVNGIDERVPVTQATGRDLIPTSHLHFHYDTVEIRTDRSTRFATCYDLKDFPKAGWGQTNPLLTLPVEFTFTQSFGCLSTAEAMDAIQAQINNLESVEDKATHQISELKEALALIAGRDLAFGDYHGALIVYGDTAESAISNGAYVTSRALNDCGFKFVKATASAPYTYMSQVPGFKTKPRPMPKSTRNLASSFSMHTYSAGKARGNPLGDGSALMPVQTVAKSLFSLNCHASRLDENSVGEKVAGHTLILGSTGTGKTTLETMLLAFLERFDPKIFALDLDQGLRIFLEEMGAVYYTLREGEPTGLAPLGLPDTKRNRAHLYDLVGACCRDENGKLSADDQRQIKHAVDTVMSLENIEHRTFSRLMESIPDTGEENSLWLRLSQWCHATNGRFAWALDNEPSALTNIADVRRIGFDVTDFLKKGYAATEPVLAHLLYLKEQMQRKGGLLATVIAEFWLPASYPTTQELIRKSLKTGRKADEFLILDSQSPEDAIQCPVFAEIRDLTATKIYLPNPDATPDGYKLLNLTDREFRTLKALSKESRTFLIKQSNQSAFATLDLAGMNDEIAVLSSSLDNVAIWEECTRDAHGDTDLRMQLFQARRKGKRDRKPEAAPAEEVE
ncbi:MAG: transporter [Burkholderia sp.]|jgi:type IV secretion system protein VirB4|uniref:VirB4 family type IV secretion/conjugal transfer ATPase n=2 Tax=Burkholderia sp. TaxID=36773 RepID=UPI002584FAAC|nr:transporter [Burkholderia sp.]MCA3785198.1 transporter [Burkholderia sp.]MCA3793079.1 transporter [Burkholderia sp.]MCA3804806.1 transporter [Burkholderia sp.]MCA3806732.1 transporter [Burkholderia sp.]MCA3829340.1 transporter [Burkholderia sp.]